MKLHAFLTIAWLLLLSAVLSLQPSLCAQQTTEDLSHGATFKFKIAANLPEFTFKVVPDADPAESGGASEPTIRQIDVYLGNDDKPLQTLEGCDIADMEAPPKDSKWFRAEDFNFDGNKDVFLLTSWGATGNQFGCVWLFDPGSGRFEYSKALSELGTYRLEPATKTIFSFSNGGAAGQVYDARRFKVTGKELALLWHEHQDWDSDKNQFQCTAEELKNGKLVSSKNLWSKPASQWSDAHAPCDPGTYFQQH